MPHFGPVSRRDLIRALRALGFDGPVSGGRHQFMVRRDVIITIPNPHGKDIGIGLLSRILRQAGVTRSQWEEA